MADTILLNGVGKRGRDVGLAYEIGERLWPISPRDDQILSASRNRRRRNRRGSSRRAPGAFRGLLCRFGSHDFFRIATSANEETLRSTCFGHQERLGRRTAGKWAPHKSTPLRAASYFRPDPVHGSPSRSPLSRRRGFFWNDSCMSPVGPGQTVGDWLILRIPRSNMCLSPSGTQRIALNDSQPRAARPPKS